MNLYEACQSAREGNFVSHNNFSSNESMHEYKGNLYYEDGADLTTNGFIDILTYEEWAKEGWFVKYSKEKVDKDKLKKLHKNNEGYMFRNNKSYEECIRRNEDD